MKMRKPFSWPPRRLKANGESLAGLVSVTSRGLALAAHAIFNSLRCPHIFWKEIQMKCWKKWEENNRKNTISAWSCSLCSCCTYFFLQIVFKLFQKVSHGRVALKVIEVIVYPQQDYPCNLERSHDERTSTYSFQLDWRSVYSVVYILS